MEFSHLPVLREETIRILQIKPTGVYVDGTVGGAGHATEIAKRLTTGRLIGIDKDPDAVKIATERLKAYPNALVVEDDFRNIISVLHQLGLEKVDGILLDLGVSSHQLDTPERGFSYHWDAPLDMRMRQDGLSAYDVVNTYDEQTLSKIIFAYSEEKFAKSIARNIVKARQEKPIETTFELAEIIKYSMPASARREQHPAKRTFQAIRIEVNQELQILEQSIKDAFACLNKDGVLAVITFHSLEDRIVKHTFASFTKGCICPPDFPVCVCNHKPEGKLVSKKPIEATTEELEQNNRSHSAKLRGIIKL